ncbi:hypothetical protein PDE_02218 [Penicillium oxalicum 114-2]|uniref:Uncharacterized protein n=1 Tax=Penicillium oxalicum (strain 114-2 / CGMCC 5302) TaxID=933388 RepID=S7Z9J2_PENO1|nr:hypothetical protein PDE_02218 [Penicillium oxalicum 114-2]
MALLELPPETILAISDQLDDEWSLNSLLRTCKGLYRLLNDSLYRHNVVFSKASSLEWSAHNNAEQTARHALRAGAISVKKDWESSLVFAAYAGYASIVQVMIDHGVNPHCTTYTREFDISRSDLIQWKCFWENCVPWNEMGICDGPILLAALAGHLDVVRVILDCADGATRPLPNNEMGSPLHLAANRGHIALVKHLVERGVPTDLLHFGQTMTPLCAAAMSGKTEVARYLIDQGADMEYLTDDHWTPVHMAALCGFPETVDLFLSRGAQVDVGNTSKVVELLLALGFLGHVAIAEKLRKAMDLKSIATSGDAEDDARRMLFLAAAACGWEDLVKLLLKRGVPANATVPKSALPLQLNAAEQSQLHIVKLLTSKYPELVNFVPTDQDSTPLISAVQKGHSEIVKVLLTAGADPNCRKKSMGSRVYRMLGTPVVFTSFKYPDILKMLLDAGAEFSEPFFTSYALNDILARGKVESLEILRPFLGSLAPRNVKKSWEILCMAMEGGPAMVGYLLSQGFSCKLDGEVAQRALSRALSEADVEMVNLLYEKGLLRHLKLIKWQHYEGHENGSYHPLSLIRSRDRDMGKIKATMDSLIAHGITVDSGRGFPWSALEDAHFDKNHIPYLELLLDRGVDFISGAGTNAWVNLFIGAVRRRCRKEARILLQGPGRDKVALKRLESALRQVEFLFVKHGIDDKEDITAMLRRLVWRRKYQQSTQIPA